MLKGELLQAKDAAVPFQHDAEGPLFVAQVVCVVTLEP
jgi:hypothetical protein